jgi:hypothetical protein
LTVEKAPCFSSGCWYGAYDGEALAAVFSSVRGRPCRFLGEATGQLVFDVPDEPRSIFALPIAAEATRLLFELAAKVVERDERSSSSDKAKVFPLYRSTVGERLFCGNVIDYGSDGRLVQWKGGGHFLGCAGEDLSEGDVVEMRRMLWYRVKPEAENPIER